MRLGSLVGDKTAVRQFLAMHTHFYIDGMVPKGSALTNGPGYRIFNADHNGIEILERSAPTAAIAIQDLLISHAVIR